jgi:hypothetical protein
MSLDRAKVRMGPTIRRFSRISGDPTNAYTAASQLREPLIPEPLAYGPDRL